MRRYAGPSRCDKEYSGRERTGSYPSILHLDELARILESFTARWIVFSDAESWLLRE